MFEKGTLFEAKYCPHCKHELQVYVLREKTTCPFCGEEFLNKNAYDGIEKDIPYQLINNKKIVTIPIVFFNNDSFIFSINPFLEGKIR